MKKVFKKATATVTAAAMLASLTACGGGAASSANHGSSEQLTPRQQGGAGATGSGSFTRYRQQGYQDRCFQSGLLLDVHGSAVVKLDPG
ncbi:MAG: hypothetical protein ACLUD2_11190 [Clostridium sp.]